jgi:transcriptional regulator with XRE-family HTH domain
VSTVLQKFGERVRDTRERQGLTQEQLAGRAGLDRSYVGGVERGEHNISLSNILKIARALGVSAADLLEEDSV